MAKLPAQQVQYVKYAEKDKNGIDIEGLGDVVELNEDRTSMTLGTNLTVDGDIGPLENIVDTDDNKRFQDFTINFDTASYGNAFKGLITLNGRVLTIVGSIDTNELTASIPASTTLKFATITIPSWIGEKIQIWGVGNKFVRHMQVDYDSDITYKPVLAVFKESDTLLSLRNISGSTIDQVAGRSISFEVNLII